MVQDFVLSYAKMIVQNPESVSVDVNSVDDALAEITLFADSEDVGKLIGKEGRMINAIKTVISGCKAKGGKSYRVSIKVNS